MIAEADDHVQRVQAGHHEVQREEDLRVAEVLRLELERRAGHVMLDELVVVLDALDAEKRRAEDHRERQERQQQLALAGLRGVHAPAPSSGCCVISTTVLMVPSVTSSSWLAAANASGYQAR